MRRCLSTPVRYVRRLTCLLTTAYLAHLLAEVPVEREAQQVTKRRLGDLGEGVLLHSYVDEALDLGGGEGQGRLRLKA